MLQPPKVASGMLLARAAIFLLRFSLQPLGVEGAIRSLWHLEALHYDEQRWSLLLIPCITVSAHARRPSQRFPGLQPQEALPSWAGQGEVLPQG